MKYTQSTADTPDAVQDPLLEVASALLGVNYLFPYQRLVISNTLEAARAERERTSRQIVILPTGAGKSLCFQLPAALLSGCSVVVYPLLSLIADQERRLRAGGFEHAVITGKTPTETRRKALASLASGSTRLLLTNPETLAQPAVADALQKIAVAHMVVDEAHCICEWGETFRPAYLNLGPAAATIQPQVLTAFTATASPYVLQSIKKHLMLDQDAHMVAASPDRPNIDYRVIPAAGTIRPLAELLDLNRPEPVCALPTSALGAAAPRVPAERPAIIFCRSRDGTRLIASQLRRALRDERIRFYHAGLSPAEKQRIEQWFFTSTDGILVATCAYGMGVDKPDIRTVLHPEPAPTVESFLQESGRAGRDGKPAVSITLAPPMLGSTASTPLPAPMAASDTGTSLPTGIQHGSSEAGAETGSHAKAGAEPNAETAALRELQRAREQAMQRFLTTDGCRRRFLLRAMGAESRDCTGCDRCSGAAHSTPPALRHVLHAVRGSRRRFTRSDLARLLTGKLVARDYAAAMHREPCCGCLADWDVHDAQDLIDTVCAAGLLLQRRRGPWRSLLDLSRNARALLNREEQRRNRAPKNDVDQ